MNIAKIASCVALTVGFSAVTVGGTEFYTDSLSTAGGNGSISAPFRTIQEGVNRLRPGDVLFIRGDSSGSGRTYQETPAFPVSGIRGNPITIRSFPGEKVIISTPNRISLNRNFLIITGLVFDHQKVGSDALSWSGKNITLSECELRNGSRDGIDITSSASDVTISNCTIHDFVWVGTARNDAHCIVAHPGVIGLRITQNKIFNCSGDGVQLYSSDSTPVSGYVSNVVIEGNTIYSTLGPNSENALDFKGGVDITVRKNQIYGFSNNKAIVVQKGAHNLLFDENVIHDSDRGVEFRWEGGNFQYNVIFQRNVLFNIMGQYALKFDGVFNAKVVNNTVHNAVGNPIRIELEGIKSGLIKNNLIHLSGSTRISGIFSADYSNNGWYSASAGALTSGTDTTGTDPHFVRSSTNDFRLNPNSSAIDRGVDTEIPYNGAAPDLGAFEFSGMLTPEASTHFTVK